MITNEDKAKHKKAYADIRVIPIDMDKLNKDLDESVKREAAKAGNSSFAPKIEEGEFFGARGRMAIIKGTQIIIDNECIGEKAKDGKVRIEIYSEIKNKEGEVTEFGMFAKFSTGIKIDELIKEFGMKETNLPTFMADRFCYNDRILRNMAGIKDWIE